MKARTNILFLLAGFLLAPALPLHAAEPLARDPDEGASPCDWLTAAGGIAQNDLHLKFEFTEPVNFEKGAAYNVFLDTDQNRQTGFRGSGGEFPLGADYLLQGAAIFRYSGSGTDWMWENVGTSEFKIDDKKLSLTVALAELGSPKGPIDFFCLGDNEAEGVGGATPDTMPDGAFANGSKLTLKP